MTSLRSSEPRKLRDGQYFDYWSLTSRTTVQSHYHIKNGGKNGIKTSWHSNKKKSEQVEIIDGKAEGVATYFYANGRIHTEVICKNGERIECTQYSEDGFPVDNCVFKDNEPWNGTWTQWWLYRKIEKCTYENGLKNGLNTKWNIDTGKKDCEGFFTIHNESSVKNGIWTYWWSSGEKKSEKIYKNGELISEEKWSSNDPHDEGKFNPYPDW